MNILLKMIVRFLIPLILILILGSCKNNTEEQSVENELTMEKEERNIAYVGSYTKKEGHVNGQAQGIYTVYQDPESGQLELGETVAEVTNPSFVKLTKDGKYLYAVSELGSKDAESGFLYSYKVNKDQTLEELGKVSTEAFAPCQIAIDQTGEYVLVTNYMGGVVMMYKKQKDGSLKKAQRIDLENPTESHAHSVSISEDNQQAYIADLGNDRIWIYDFDAAKGELQPNNQAFVQLEEGAGPRHFAFSKNQHFAYSINELNSTVSTFAVKENGGLEVLQNTPSLPEGFDGKNSAADIHLHPSGDFLYVSNRGHNSIASYKINKESGKLSSTGFWSTGGKTPRNFAIGPNGKFLYVANQDSNNIGIFKIDLKTGILNQVLNPVEADTPVCIDFAQNNPV